MLGFFCQVSFTVLECRDEKYPQEALNLLVVKIDRCDRIWKMQSPVIAPCTEHFEESGELYPDGQTGSNKDTQIKWTCRRRLRVSGRDGR